ncbi:Hypothetical predicted protein [Octopus vulgaris]|uniref:Uncharacterized protein n=1 Tax=Octopus vulgaris TaxID=6645 RepID=A0AA36FIE8_OCTVU|nr:Hypothetical predicted protein [Octopus vulgaris]
MHCSIPYVFAFWVHILPFILLGINEIRTNEIQGIDLTDFPFSSKYSRPSAKKKFETILLQEHFFYILSSNAAMLNSAIHPFGGGRQNKIPVEHWGFCRCPAVGFRTPHLLIPDPNPNVDSIHQSINSLNILGIQLQIIHE